MFIFIKLLHVIYLDTYLYRLHKYASNVEQSINIHCVLIKYRHVVTHAKKPSHKNDEASEIIVKLKVVYSQEMTNNA